MPLSREKTSRSTPHQVVRLSSLVIFPFIASLTIVAPHTTDTTTIPVAKVVKSDSDSDSDSGDLVVESHFNSSSSRYGHGFFSCSCFRQDTIHFPPARGPPEGAV